MAFLLSFFDSFLLIDFISGYNSRKWADSKHNAAFIVFVSIAIASSVLFYETTFYNDLIVILYFAISLVYSFLALNGSAINKVMGSFIFCLGLFFINTIVTLGYDALFAVKLRGLMDMDIFLLSSLGIGRIILFYYTRVVLDIKNNKLNRLSATTWLSISMVPILSVIVMTVIMKIGISSSLDPRGITYLFIFVIWVLVTNIASYFLFQHASHEYQNRVENSLVRNSIKNYILQSEESGELFKVISGIRQEDKNQLLHIETCLLNDQIDYALNYVHKVSKINRDAQKIIVTNDHFFDSAINAKIAIAKSKNIGVQHGISMEFKSEISSTDLVLIVGGLFDNALKACEKITKNDSLIEIYIKKALGEIQIEMRNTIPASILESNPSLKSSKDDNRQWGIGLINIRKIVSSYKGTMNLSENDGIFYVNITFPA